MTDDRKISIFIVDDEPVIAWTLAKILGTQGFEVAFFTDSLEALKAATASAPNILISDVLMPRMTGVDLAIVVKERCPTCQVLLLSGQTGTANLLSEAESKGYQFSVLEKPLHPANLLKAVTSLSAKLTG